MPLFTKKILLNKIKLNQKKKKLFELFFLIKYNVFSFLGLIYRSIRYKTDYFLDTNFVITSDKKLDNRYKKLFLICKNYYTTEIIEKEIKEKLKNKQFSEINKFKRKTISFNDLYNIAPICPVYHNFIAAMYNPANFFDLEFTLQLLLKKTIEKKELTDEEEKIYMMLRNNIYKKLNSNINFNGKIKNEWEKNIDLAYLRSIKKRKKCLSGKNKNSFNDIINLATIFTYSLIYKRNVTFLTSDSDAIAFFFSWSSSIVQQVVINTKCLEKLNENDRKGMKNIFQNKKEALFFNFPELVKFIQDTLQIFYSNNGKYFSPRLSIKYWDKKTKKYYEVGVNLDDTHKKLLMHLHGSLNCPTAKNNVMGSFIKYIYWWPPSSNWDGKILKILSLIKPIYKESYYTPTYIHDKECLYRKSELSKDFSVFSAFK